MRAFREILRVLTTDNAKLAMSIAAPFTVYEALRAYHGSGPDQHRMLLQLNSEFRTGVQEYQQLQTLSQTDLNIQKKMQLTEQQLRQTRANMREYEGMITRNIFCHGIFKTGPGVELLVQHSQALRHSTDLGKNDQDEQALDQYEKMSFAEKVVRHIQFPPPSDLTF